MENLNISRDGEPVLKRGPGGGSLTQQNRYEIRTTPALPANPRGYNWAMFFGKHHKGGRFLLEHNHVDKITAECSPDDEPHLIEVVDATIEKANDEEAKIQYEPGTV
jgi:hypothetical protein